jgi:hypothetical protein
MAPQTGMFPSQQLHWNRVAVFSTWSVTRCYKQNLGAQGSEAVGESVSKITARVQLLRAVAVRSWQLRPGIVQGSGYQAMAS